MRNVFINQIAIAVPDNEIHQRFIQYAKSNISDDLKGRLFARMADSSQINHRYSVLSSTLNVGSTNEEDFYVTGRFPNTEQRMDMYKKYAFSLAKKAINKLEFDFSKITHIIITSCTGFYAPGIDLEIMQFYELPKTIERYMISFMGCYAAINALKMATNIVRSTPEANVLIVNLELCSLHFQESNDLEKILSFLIFADGCAASIVSSIPSGIEIESFYSTLLPESKDYITWHIGNNGFDMDLSGKVPSTISKLLPHSICSILGDHKKGDITYWAIHPGGRSILDAVQKSLVLEDYLLRFSRKILWNYGNMSSATVMFVLEDMLHKDSADDDIIEKENGMGCAIAFGPGIMVESMMFQIKKNGKA